MWFIFPQIAGLGRSAISQEYAITSLDEARAYLNHPLLGDRLITCTRIVVNVENHSAEMIFGYPDYLKFQSCMTLFAEVSDDKNIFQAALAKYYDGQPDENTLRLLATENG